MLRDFDHREPEEIKNPLFSIEAEQSLIGACLTNNSGFIHVSGVLEPDHFYHPAHQIIWKKMVELFNEKIEVRPETLLFSPEMEELLKEVGGVKVYIPKMQAAAIAVINIRDYADLVVQLADARKLKDACLEAIEKLEQTDQNPREIVSDLEKSLHGLDDAGDNRKFMTDLQVVDLIIDDIKLDRRPIKTGINSLDDAMGGGLFTGFSYGFAAKKKSGKTVLAASISQNLADAGEKHLFICGEMTPQEIHTRNLCKMLNVYPDQFRDPEWRNNTENQMKIYDLGRKATNSRIYRKEHGLTFARLINIITYAVYRFEIKGFILDYWQLVGGQRKGQSQANHLDEVAQWISDFCRKHNLWSITTAQINQEGNTRGGEGIRLAFDQVYQLHRIEGDNGAVWVEMMDTRYTKWRNLGSVDAAGLVMHDKAPFFLQAPHNHVTPYNPKPVDKKWSS